MLCLGSSQCSSHPGFLSPPLGRDYAVRMLLRNAECVMDFHGKVAMKSAWGEAKAEETMTGFSNTFLLFSIFLRTHLCQEDSMEKQRLKQDLLIGMMCVFMILLVFLILGCIFFHFTLINKDMPLKEELKSYAIQTHGVETRTVLSSSQANQLTSPKCKAVQPPSKKPTTVKSKDKSTTPLNPKPSHKRSISHIYRSSSSESIYLDESGSIYSLEHFQCLYSTSWSDSKESLTDRGSEDEECGESNESGSTLFFAIHPM